MNMMSQFYPAKCDQIIFEVANKVFLQFDLKKLILNSFDKFMQVYASSKFRNLDQSEIEEIKKLNFIFENLSAE